MLTEPVDHCGGGLADVGLDVVDLNVVASRSTVSRCGWGVSPEAGSGDDVGGDPNRSGACLHELFSKRVCRLRGVVAVGDAGGDVFDLVGFGGIRASPSMVTKLLGWLSSLTQIAMRRSRARRLPLTLPGDNAKARSSRTKQTGVT